MRRIRAFLAGFGGAACAAGAIAACAATLAVWWGALNQDEGWYLYAAQMVRDGLLPYRDFFFTQGPAMPFVYALFADVWAKGSILSGLLGGRLVTLGFSLAATGCAVACARRLAAPAARRAAGLAAFALLACNLYHAYFTAIPKTYALGTFLLTAGLRALLAGYARRAFLPLAGLLMACASGTRISLVLALPVSALALACRGFGRGGFAADRSLARNATDFLLFCAGGFAGLALVYGYFSHDPASLRGLLAAQAYHAARGGFDPFFALGSVSRWARGYAAAGILLFVGLVAGGRPAGGVGAWGAKTCLAIFAAVFCLQLSAPFPYDDYQVPLMPVLCAAIAAVFAGQAGRRPARLGWFAVLTAGLCSFASPLLQEWATNGQDRFWSRKKETTELALLRETARRIEELDPKGTELLTQDLYLAIETGRRVPRGLEMGPFSYFGDLPTDAATELNVLNPERMARLLDAAEAPVAAFSGYGFAISVPTCAEVPFAAQTEFWKRLKKNYNLAFRVDGFGQNATTLLVLKRKPGAGE